jgi:predicted transcriptional regulator
MNTKTRNTILSTISRYGNVDSYMLMEAFGRKNFTRAFDNSIMRYVRRLREAGYLKRSTRGFYNVTARGRKFIEKTLGE